MSFNMTKSVVAFIVISFGVAAFSFVVWVLPGFFMTPHLAKITDAKPYSPLQLEGRDVYMSQGCHVCHTQMVRNLEAERLRYGRANKMEDDIYEHSFLWGSSRIGPDLTNIGLKYTEDWQIQHLKDPQSLVPESIMPPFVWLFEQPVDSTITAKKMQALRKLGVPYSDEEIANAEQAVNGKTKGDALVAYLMSLGVDTHKNKKDLQ
ncbi:cbb3-type cytochrome c oxidase subunit II [Vibrio lentus]|uniref:Cytochrome oxidase n=1 Tax=Vibrio lentus TaxID=136468 RepID=A0AB36XIS4_9VIBR|nr:cbb3-type cytochrome c oxidase subunit II [Vibrio lentus]MCC4840274.1 cbb3-type cytochrome c oxidase subunit II [Vibrio lentus]PMI12586.1 cytochrome oxidase [Vibrio lentus]PMK32499.1 cytochrome oxidase [Vibrio lentus]PMK45040.1 cytochrome oxidase [Vibrio lentus]PML28877.1 cytochrome oxidase [Vibrio lentus]